MTHERQTLRSVFDRLPLPEGNIVGIGAGFLLHKARPRGRRTSRRGLGWALVGAGVGVNTWAMFAHGGGDLERPTRLVTTGPYAYSRNPMYLGWHLIHLGVGVASGSGAVLATLPAAVAYAHRGVEHEETELARQFGAEFTGYQASVPRYLWSDIGPLNGAHMTRLGDQHRGDDRMFSRRMPAAR